MGQRRAADKAAFEEREQRRAAGKAAFEERQQRRAERAEAAKSWTATRDTDTCSIASTDCSTASTASTVADLPPCSFCRAKALTDIRSVEPVYRHWYVFQNRGSVGRGACV